MRRAEIESRPMWKCCECGTEKVATAHQSRQKYCSRDCSAKAYSTRMVGAANPNFKDAGKHTCLACRSEFHSYDKARKYCSPACNVQHNIDSIRERALKGAKAPKTRSTPRLGNRCTCKACGIEFRHPSKRSYCDAHRKEARAAQGKGNKKDHVSVKITAQCGHCGDAFEHYPSAKRKYCSYECHLASGGALRAGKASGTMTRKYGAKKDANHKEIVTAFKNLGAHVLDLSTMGNGVPDLVVWCASRWVLVDVKNPKTGYGRRGLNKNQKEWAEAWQGGPVYMVATIDEVIQMVKGNFDGIKRFPEDRGHSPSDPKSKDGTPVVHVIETAEQAIAILTGEGKREDRNRKRKRGSNRSSPQWKRTGR